MPPEQFSAAKETIESVERRLQSAHCRFEGARVRVALARVNSSYSFLTGALLFLEHEAESRRTADYGHIRLSEFWIHGVDAAIGFVGRLFEGDESIQGVPVRSHFKRSMAHRENGRNSASDWPSWVYQSWADPMDDKTRLNLEPIPTVAKGLPPFKSPAEAVTSWMGQTFRHGLVGGNVPNQDQFLIVIPDTRARFQSCRWSPGLLNVQVEHNTDSESIELQVIHGGTKSSSANHSIRPGVMSIGVPENAVDLSLFLVHDSGELLAFESLTQNHRWFGEVEAEDAHDHSQLQSDLQNGENERREFKPFIAPNDKKELEVVQTAVAFANTDGGRIFIGVDDEGVPLGTNEARKRLKCEDPIASQIAQIKSLIREKTQPVPTISCRTATVGGQPIIVVEIEKSEVLCSTHDNRAYVRRGATNRLADPRTEIPSLNRGSNFDPWGTPLFPQSQ